MIFGFVTCDLCQGEGKLPIKFKAILKIDILLNGITIDQVLELVCPPKCPECNGQGYLIKYGEQPKLPA